MAAAWRRRGGGMAAAWRRHGGGVAAAWRRRGGGGSAAAADDGRGEGKGDRRRDGNATATDCAMVTRSE
jgi:hypothetical protein